MITLFCLESTIANGADYDFTREEFPSYTNVKIEWFVNNRQNDLVYSNLLPNFDDLKEQEKTNAISYLSESFTDGEAQSLKEYLLAKYSLESDITTFTPSMEKALSYQSKAKMDATSIQSLTDSGTVRTVLDTDEAFLALADKQGYTLNFDVRGYYNLREAKSEQQVG